MESGSGLRIMEIALRRFKSYKKPEGITFHSPGAGVDFIAVCGSNGSGKSSLVHALSWVLGVSPGSVCFVLSMLMPTLVALKSLIYGISGTDTATHSPMSVEVVMQCWSGEDLSFLSIRRTAAKAGTKFSVAFAATEEEGWLPRKTVTRKWLWTHLLQYGLDLSVPQRQFIHQNQVQALVSSTPQQHLQFVEQVVGTAGLAAQIEELAAKARDITGQVSLQHQELTRLNGVLSALEPHVARHAEFVKLRLEHRSGVALEIFLRQSLCCWELENVKWQLPQARHRFVKQKELHAKCDDKCNSVLAAETSQLAAATATGKELKQVTQQCKKALSVFEELMTRKEFFQRQLKRAKKIIKRHRPELLSAITECEDLEASLETKRSLVDHSTAPDTKMTSSKQSSLREQIDDVSEELELLQQAASSNRAARKEMGRKKRRLESSYDKKLAEVKACVLIQKKAKKTLEKHIDKLAKCKASKKWSSGRVRQIEGHLGPLQALLVAHDALEEQSVIVPKATPLQVVVDVLREEFGAGRVHGTLLELGVTVNSEKKVAINAILGRAIARTIVVQSRVDATAVAKTIQQRSPLLPAAALDRLGSTTCLILEEQSEDATAAEGGLEPAMNFLKFADPQYKHLFSGLLGNWRIATSRAEAVAAVEGSGQRRPRFPVVTIKGELFHASGEISTVVGSVRSRLAVGGLGAHKSTSTTEPARHVGSKIIRRAQLTLATLLQERAEETKEIEKRRAQAGLIQDSIEDMEAESGKITKELRSLERDSELLQGKLLRLERESEKLGIAEAAVGERLKEAQRREKSLTAALKRLQKECPPSKYEKLQESIRKLEQRLKKANGRRKRGKAAVAKAEEDIAKSTASLTPMEEKDIPNAEAAMDAANMRKAILQQALTAEQARHAETAAALKELQRQRQVMEEELVSFQEAFEALKARRAVLAAEKTGLRRRMEDIDPTLAESHQTVLDDFQGTLAGDEPDEKIIERCGATIRDTAHATEHLGEAVKNMERTVDFGAVEQHASILAEKSSALQRFQSLQKECMETAQQKSFLERKRFSQLTASIKTINASLSKLYRRLTKTGDLYLRLPQEASLLNEGVELMVKPDKSVWQRFRKLSVGQKALSSLAMALALHAAFPGPFIVMDEIDASLDSQKAAAVGQLLKNDITCQVIVVSHRPEVYRHADMIVGVYQSNGTSRAVSHVLNTSA